MAITAQAGGRAWRRVLLTKALMCLSLASWLWLQALEPAQRLGDNHLQGALWTALLTGMFFLVLGLVVGRRRHDPRRRR